MGAGQQNRVDCVRLAGEKATMWWNRLTIDLDKDWKFSDIQIPDPEGLHD